MQKVFHYTLSRILVTSIGATLLYLFVLKLFLQASSWQEWYDQHLIVTLVATTMFIFVLYRMIRSHGRAVVITDEGLTVDGVSIEWKDISECYRKKRVSSEMNQWVYYLRTKNDRGTMELADDTLIGIEDLILHIRKKALRARFITLLNPSSLPFGRIKEFAWDVKPGNVKKNGDTDFG